MKIDDISFAVIDGDVIDNSGNIKEEPYRLKYESVFTYGIAATKELDSLVQSQQKVINDLKSENESLKIQNESIKTALNELLVLAGKPTLGL